MGDVAVGRGSGRPPRANHPPPIVILMNTKQCGLSTMLWGYGRPGHHNSKFLVLCAGASNKKIVSPPSVKLFKNCFHIK